VNSRHQQHQKDQQYYHHCVQFMLSHIETVLTVQIMQVANNFILVTLESDSTKGVNQITATDR